MYELQFPYLAVLVLVGRIRAPFERLAPLLLWLASEGGSVEVLGKLAATCGGTSSANVECRFKTCGACGTFGRRGFPI